MYEKIFHRISCPHCHKSLMDDTYKISEQSSVKLDITKKSATHEKGWIFMSPIYGYYATICNIDVDTNEILEMSCPHCEKSLTSNIECEICGTSVAVLEVTTGGRVMICSRKGCKENNITYEDISITLTDYISEGKK